MKTLMFRKRMATGMVAAVALTAAFACGFEEDQNSLTGTPTQPPGTSLDGESDARGPASQPDPAGQTSDPSAPGADLGDPNRMVDSGVKIEDYDALLELLEARDYAVERGDDVDTMFDRRAKELIVNGEELMVYEFATQEDAREWASRIGRDGDTITFPEGGQAIVDWIAPPHFYLRDTVAVQYVGEDDLLVSALQGAFGPQFAGADTPGVLEPAPDYVPDYEEKSVAAPIDGVDVVVRDSFPPQYVVLVRSGLPSGCARFERIAHERDGDVIKITVTNLMPDDTEIACTAIYGIAQNGVDLGSDFEEGKKYTVIVNDEHTTEFVAGEVSPMLPTPAPTPHDPADRPVTGPTPAPIDPGAGGGLISGYDALMYSLQSGSVTVEQVKDMLDTGMFGASASILRVNGQDVQVYEFRYPQDAQRIASGVSPGGGAITNPDGTEVSVPWDGPPHFYLQGNVIALYVGDDEDVVAALDGVAWKFAGADSKPIDELGDSGGSSDPGFPGDPIPVEPDHGNGTTPDGNGDLPEPGAVGEMVPAIAPVASVELAVMESFPVQYGVHIVTEQPSGCVEHDTHTVERDGTTINITVTNLEPADPETICTMILKMHETNINLGSDFESGVEYTVNVNDQVQETFIAQ
ncbi:MAG: hypothetical protein WD208_10855 [Dehalococcoidia bacterium]